MPTDSPKDEPPRADASAPVPSESRPDSSSTASMWRQASRFSYIGIFFGVAVVIGYWAGHSAERRWGGAPWPSLAGVLVGIAAGFRELFRIARGYSSGRS